MSAPDAFGFTIEKIQDGARTGRLVTPHGTIHTPAFIPVGTQATVKAVRSTDLTELGTQIIMCNTYHLYLRPGSQVITNQGRLHSFMNWSGPLMTDSGGFQVLSLGAGIEHGVGKHIDLFVDDSKVEAIARVNEKKDLVIREKLCVVTDERIIFKSHLDGTFHEWTPEKSVDVQQQLGADLIFALDECTSPLHDRDYTEKSLHRSHAWEERSLVRLRDHKVNHQAMYGIIQGGPYEDLRRESAKFVELHDFFGVGIGGALMNKTIMRDILDWVSRELSGRKPVHLLGIGSIDDIFTAVELGVDTFDCADPTRIARRGDVLMLPDDEGRKRNRWRISLTASQFQQDRRPISLSCRCSSCTGGFTRAYLHHLLWARELLAYTLTTVHNLWVMHRLMEEIREGIDQGNLGVVKERWMG